MAPPHTMETLQSRLEEAEAQVQEYKDLLQRVQADYANYKRRNAEELIEGIKIAGADLIKELLPVIDDFERALGSVSNHGSDSDWAQGVALIKGKLMAALEQRGLSQVESEGKPFDPTEHEATAVEVTEDVEEGTITVVHQMGYKLHGRLLRPARVSVAKRPGGSQDDQSK